ncbi:hypothetical protein J5O02_04315 [Streptococcus suis]|uniref:DUF6985 domain-containing protein n=1 Tax=Streptococcus suis TaxID=1307 RepID=UPI000CF6B80E|nr:hypothetical protein [Streptococcus suis]MBO3756293.1 hypothetical protein [Streptococcus suis]
MKLNHNVFGEIIFDEFYWTKSISLKIFGELKTIEVAIDADEDAGFEREQVESYIEFFKNINHYIQLTEKGVFQYYNEKIADQPLTEIEDIYPMVSIEQIFIPINTKPDMREIGFLGECSWEPEHGLGIRFINENITEVGFQDVLL